MEELSAKGIGMSKFCDEIAKNTEKLFDEKI